MQHFDRQDGGVVFRLKTTSNCLEGVAIQFQWASLATAGRRWFAPLPSHLKAAPRHRLWCKRTLLRSVRSGPHLLAGGHWPARITGWIHFSAECLAFAQELHNASPVAHDPRSRYFAEVKAWQGAKRRAVVLSQLLDARGPLHRSFSAAV